MKHRILTDAENLYVQELCLRQIHIRQQVDSLMHKPMQEIHEATGLRNIVILTMLMEAAGWVNLDLEAALYA